MCSILRIKYPAGKLLSRPAIWSLPTVVIMIVSIVIAKVWIRGGKNFPAGRS